MSRLKNLLFATFISPELVLALIVLVISYFAPTYTEKLGIAIHSDTEIWKYLPALTLIFSGAAINSSFKLRAPLESFSNKRLYEWPLYQLLVDRVYIGISFGIISAAASLMLWILGENLEPTYIAVIFLTATLVSGTTALSMLLAQQRLRELVERHT